MATITDWTYVAIVGSFVLGMIIGMALGKRKAMTDMLMQQQRMEATKAWTEAVGKMMGGKHGGHN